MTESCLADQQKRLDGGSDTPVNDSFGWSPCPRGGLFTLPGGSSGPVTVTPINATLSLSDSSTELQNNSSSPVRSRPLERLCAGEPDIKWTSAMATPLSYGNSSVSPGSMSRDKDTTSTVTASLSDVKPKVFHRQLFSPGDASACDDSLSKMLEACSDVDLTVESERSLVNEDDFENTWLSSQVTPPGFGSRKIAACKHSTPIAGVLGSVAGGSRARKGNIFQQSSAEGAPCAARATEIDEYFDESLVLSAADMDVIEHRCRPDDRDNSHHLTVVNGSSGFMPLPESKHIKDSVLRRKSSEMSETLPSKRYIEVLMSEIFPSPVSPRSLEGENSDLGICEKEKVGALEADLCASVDQEAEIPLKDVHSCTGDVGRAGLDLNVSSVCEKVVFKETDRGREGDRHLANTACKQPACQDKGDDMDVICQQQEHTLAAEVCAEEQQTVLADTNSFRQKANLDMSGAYSSRSVNGAVSIEQLETTRHHSLCLESHSVVADNRLRQDSDRTETSTGSNRISRKRRRSDREGGRNKRLSYGDKLIGGLFGGLHCKHSLQTDCLGNIQDSFNKSTSFVESLNSSVENPVILKSILKDSVKQKAAVAKRVRFNLAINSSERSVKKTPKCLQFTDEAHNVRLLNQDRAASYAGSSSDMLDLSEKECCELLSMSENSDAAGRNDACSTFSDSSYNSNSSSCLTNLSLSVPAKGSCSVTIDQNDSLTSSQVEDNALRDECEQFEYIQCSSPGSPHLQPVLQDVNSADIRCAEPMRVDQDIDGCDFDYSFQLSPTFGSQVLKCSQITGNKELPAGDKELPAGNKELPAGDKELPAGNKELPAGSKELPARAALCISGMDSHDVHVAHSCDVCNNILDDCDDDFCSVHHNLFSGHTPAQQSVNDVYTGENKEVNVRGGGEKVSDSKVEVVGNVSEFSLDGGMDCAAALQVESADNVLQSSGVQMFCEQAVFAIMRVAGESSQSQLELSGVMGIPGENSQSQLEMSGVKKIGRNSEIELDVSKVRDVVCEKSQGNLHVSCHATDLVTALPLSSAPSSLLPTTALLSAALRSTTATSFLPSSFQVAVTLAPVPLKACCAVAGTSTMVLTALSPSSIPPLPSPSLTPPPPSPFTATLTTVIAPAASASVTTSKSFTISTTYATSAGLSLTSPSTTPPVCTASSSTTTVASTTAAASTTTPASASSTTASSAVTTTAASASTTIATSASTTTASSAVTTTAASASTTIATSASTTTASSAVTTTAASASTTIATSASITTGAAASTTSAFTTTTTKPLVVNSSFINVQPSLHILRRKKKFIYPTIKQTTCEIFSIQGETARSFAGVSFSGQEPMEGDVRKGPKMKPRVVLLEESAHAADVLSEQLARSSGAAVQMPGQSAVGVKTEAGLLRKTGQFAVDVKTEVGPLRKTGQCAVDVKTEVGPLRKTGQLLGFAKFSDVFQMSDVKSTSGTSSASDTVLPPTVLRASTADSNNQSKANVPYLSSSTRSHYMKVRHVASKLINDIPSQHADSRECLPHGIHSMQTIQTSATCVCVSELDVASETNLLEQNSTTGAGLNKPATFSAGSSSCVRDDDDIDITSQMWSRTEFSQMQTGQSDNDTDGWDSEDSILEHAQQLGDEPPLDSPSQIVVSHEQASRDRSLDVASFNHLVDSDQTEQFSCGKIGSECISKLDTSHVLNQSKLPRMLSGEDNLEGQLDNLFQGLKRQLKIKKEFVVPFVRKNNSGKPSRTPDRKLAENGNHKVHVFDDFLVKLGSDVCTKEKDHTDLRDDGNRPAVQKNIVLDSTFEYPPKEKFNVSSTCDTNGVCCETIVINPKPGLSSTSRGFSTASGKSICVSEDAKSQAWKLMQDSMKSTELDDLKNASSSGSECKEGCVTAADARVSSSCVTSVQVSSYLPTAERDIISGSPLITEEAQVTSGPSAVNHGNSSSFAVVSSSSHVTSNSLSSASAALSPNLSCIPPISVDVSTDVTPVALASAGLVSGTVASPSSIDDPVDNQGVPRIDKSYKGFHPFKPPRMLPISKKNSARGELKLKESLQQGLSSKKNSASGNLMVKASHKQGVSRINVDESKNSLDEVVGLIQKPKESDSVDVNDNLVDDWEDDSSFRDLILVDGAVTCATSNGGVDVRHTDVHFNGGVHVRHTDVHFDGVEVSDTPGNFVEFPGREPGCEANTDLDLAAKGHDTKTFPEGETQTRLIHRGKCENLVSVCSESSVMNGSLTNLCNTGASGTLPDTAGYFSNTSLQRQPQSGCADPLLHTLNYGHQQLNQEKQQVQITARHTNNSKTVSHSSDACQLESQIPAQLGQEKKSANLVGSSCLAKNKSPKDIQICLDNDKSCTGVLKGFMTARGGSVSVSESALLQAKKMLSSEDSEEDMPGIFEFRSKTSSISCTNRLQKSVMRSDSDHAAGIMWGEKSVDEQVWSTSKSLSVARNHSNADIPENQQPASFCAAPGVCVPISETAIETASSVINETGESCKKTKSPGIMSDRSTARGLQELLVEDALKNARDVQEASGVAGGAKEVLNNFSTAARDSVTSVSETALERPGCLGGAGDGDDVQDVMPPFSVGFSTASGSKVSVSDKALQHARRSVGGAGDGDDVQDVMPPFSFGFSTASGSKVSVSEKALQHAKRSIGGAEDGNGVKDVMPPFSVGFSTASGSKVSVSEKALQHAKSFLADREQTFEKLVKTPDMQSVSGELLNPGKLLQCDEMFHSKTHDTELATAPFSVAPRPHAAVNRLQNKHSSTIKPAIKNNSQTVSYGFSTASGSKIHVSDEALRSAKNVLDEAEDSTSSGKVEALKSFKVPCKPVTSPYGSVNPDACSGISSALSVSLGEMEKQDLNLLSELAKRDKQLFEDGAGSSTGDSKTNVNGVCDLTRNLFQPNEACITRRSRPVEVTPDHISRHQNHPTSDRAQENTAGGSAPQVCTEPKLTSGSRWLHKKELQTPVRSSCEGFHYDRRSTKGRNLSAVLSQPLNSVAGTAPPAPSVSAFQPPFKKTKMSDDDYSHNRTTTRSTSHSGTSANTTRPTSSCVSPSPTLSALPRKLVSYTRTSDECERSKHDLHPKTTPARASELGNPNGQFLFQESISQEHSSVNEESSWSGTVRGAAAEFYIPSDSSRSMKMDPGAVLGSRCSFSRQHKPLSDSTSHSDAGQCNISFDLTLEEARMKQDAVIRRKCKGIVRPVCGRWLEFRKRKEALKTFKSLGLAPETGLSREELLNHGLSDCCLEVNSLNAGNFRFDLRRFYPGLDAGLLLGDGALLVPDKHGFSGAQEFYRALLTLDGVDPKLVDEAWVQNHYRWIVWKLAAYEVCFPHAFAGRSLTPEVVMLQLKYRYDREIDGCHRSAIKKIVERDDTSCKRIVLCVASVKQTLNGQFSVELTDGWYVIPGHLDECLTHLVARKRIQIGDKIVTSGAELVGPADGCSPLELKEDTVLKLHGNSTRPAPWYSRLGFCSPPSGLCVSLRSLSPAGGLASCVGVVFCRRYPVMYMEKLPDGSSVFRTAEEEDRARQRHEDRFQLEGEKVYMSLQKELEENSTGFQTGRGRKCQKDVKSLFSGQDLASALEDDLNPEELQQSLSSSQMDRLMKYRQAEIDRRQQEINRRMQEAMADACKPRHVTPVVKFKVRGCCRSDVDSKSSCQLVVWRPGSEWMQVEEGQRYQLFNVSVSSGRGRSEQGKVALTATRQTRMQLCPISDNLLDIVYNQRDAWTVSELSSGRPFEDEFDFVGVVIQVVAPLRSTSPTCVFAADKNREILCIRFWTSAQSACLRPGQCFVASNLILARSLQHGSGLVSADARSDVTCISTSARPASRYSDQWTKVQAISKTKGFLSDLQTKVQVRGFCTDSKHHTPGHLTSRPDDYDEDFPQEIIDKIFTPMSQEAPVPDLHLSNHRPRDNQQGLSVACSSLKTNSCRDETQQSSDSRGSCSSVVSMTSVACTYSAASSKQSTKHNITDRQSALFKDRHLASKINQANVHSEKNKSVKRKCEDAELDISDSMVQMNKRKSILRAKMSKLLAYDRPSKLCQLPCGNSPASSREFKSPVAKKL
ncbi:hypothetical protein BsWGS_23604 [Bradybaena similaris]